MPACSLNGVCLSVINMVDDDVDLDMPPCYTHYYSNPSYHTLSPCTPSLPIPAIPEQPSSGKVRDLLPLSLVVHSWMANVSLSRGLGIDPTDLNGGDALLVNDTISS